MFLGTTFSGSSSAFSNTVVPNNSITSIKVSNCAIDELYATKDVLLTFNWTIPTDWQANTALHGTYENTLSAGNTEYTSENISAVKIKKRYVGDFDWRTIYIQEVNSNEDFQVRYYDYYSPKGREIEYAYVLVLNSTDIEVAVSRITPDFDSYFICGQNGESYPMIVNVANTPTYTRESTVIRTVGRKYPYVNHNGLSQYYIGNITVSFIAMDENCHFDANNAWKYRNEIDQFLANGETKILKSFEGDIWMVDVINDIPRSNSGHYQLVDHQIEWVEIGNPFSIGDLYDNGFIDTDIDRE